MVQAVESTNLGLVSQCDATNCIYNSKQQCTAGAIDISFEDELAKCFTYTTSDTEEPVASLSVSVEEVGVVSQCDVIDCTYNEGQRCIAESITITFGNDTAQCATYITSSGATG